MSAGIPCRALEVCRVVLRVVGHGPVGRHVTCRGTSTDRLGAYFHLLAGSVVWPSRWVRARTGLSASWTGTQTVGSSDPPVMGVPEHRGWASLTLCSRAQLLDGHSDLPLRPVDQADLGLSSRGSLSFEFRVQDDYPDQLPS